MKFLLFLFLFFPVSGFTQTDLPQIILSTNGEWIPDEPKVKGTLTIKEGGVVKTTSYMGIETRGSSSQMFPKKSYGVELWTEAGEDTSLSLLGFPKESDWILYAPYTDKTMLRDVLTFYLASRMGHYASRFRFVELTLNDEYLGVYVLLEKIKRGKSRVNISKMESGDSAPDSLTGGYILKIDKTTGDWSGGWWSPYQTNGKSILYQFEYPKAENITSGQSTYIQNWVTDFEHIMNSESFSDPVSGYPKWIDVNSFVDFVIINELGKNIDGYRLSSFLHKDRDSKGGKLVAGPVWDFNLAFGNADYFEGYRVTGLQYEFNVEWDWYQNPFWWKKLMTDSTFQNLVKTRYSQLRKTILNNDSLSVWIRNYETELTPAAARNYEKWPILGQYVWPNYYIGETYHDEINWMVNWIKMRIAWLDVYLPGKVLTGVESEELPDNLSVSEVYPNPFNPETRLSIKANKRQSVTADLYDLTGKKIRQVFSGVLNPESATSIVINGTGLSSGIYFIRVNYSGGFVSRRAVIIK